MARLSDLPLKYRLFMATYRYRTLPAATYPPLRKPLSGARLALVTTGALHLPDQEPFDEEVKGGDTTFRVLPNDVDPRVLRIAHRSEAFDHAGLEADQNLAFPIDRLREMEAAGEVTLAPRHLSFMGSITAPGRLLADTAPKAADLLVADGVEAALLTPV
jgi:D-proline reductase (dithiol) PrdB